MFFQDMALRFSEMLAEDALLFGLSEEKEVALKELSKGLAEREIEVPYVVQKVLGWIHEEEPQEILDRSGAFSFELSSVQARLIFDLRIDAKKIKLSEDIIKSEIELRFDGTEWGLQEICRTEEVSEPESALSSLKNLTKGVRSRLLKVEVIANCFESIDGETEEQIIEKLIEFREREFVRLKNIFDDAVSIEILSKHTDIVVINE